MPILNIGRPFTEVDHLGVLIGYSQPDQMHCGFLYKLDGDVPRLAHQEWHERTTFEPISREMDNWAQFQWVNVNLEDENKKFIAGQLSLLGQNPPKLPYAFDYNGQAFDDSGNPFPLPMGKGLTCATFVVAFLRGFGFDLIDEQNWPARAEDQDWQERILAAMIHYDVDAAHVDAVRQDVGAKRVRPEEATAAVTLDFPCSFDEIHLVAAEIIADLAMAA